MISNITISNDNEHYVSKFNVLLFCGYIVIWFLQVGNRYTLLGNIRIEFFYALLLFLISLKYITKDKLESKLLFYVSLYFFILFLSLIFSYDYETSIFIFENRILKFSIVAYFIICFITNPKDLRLFIAAFLLACFKMGEEGFVGKITGSMMWQNQGVMRLHGITPLYEHPNSFAGMALGTLPFIYALWPISNKYIKTMLLILAIFALNIILFTGSRTGYIGIFVFLIVQCLMVRKFKFIISLLIISCLAYFYIPNEYKERIQSIYTLQEKEGKSSEKRIVILKDATDIFLRHPFGVGIQAFPKVRKSYFDREQDTHNLYMEVATNLGIQGIIVFTLLIYNMLKILFKIKYEMSQLLLLNYSILQIHIHNDNNLEEVNCNIHDIRFISSVASAVILYIIIRLALGLFGMDLYEIYWWLAIGITVSLYNISKYIANKTHILSKIVGT